MSDDPFKPCGPQGRAVKPLVGAVCVLLAALVGFVFGQTVRHDFINFDDDEYVYENARVKDGLTWEGAGWAFAHTHSANWHPVTWLSHMLDCEVYGLDPAGHHLTNVLLHGATAILLFLALRQLTGGIWGSAFAAFVFAIHPLRVESVAWIAERKDVLSGLFFVLTLLAYKAYATHRTFKTYLLTLLLFALGLMAKPMLVTLPFVLLLLDYWPLGRISNFEFRISNSEFRSALWPLVREKIPMLLLCAASCAVTLVAQKEAIAPLPPGQRFGNVPVSYVTYLGQWLCPTRLIAYYPHPEAGLSGWRILAATVLLAAVTVAVLAARKKGPWLLVGWLWYLGMLVPVIGILQVGSQAHADRYTYLPQIGLCLMLAAAIAQSGARRLRWRLASGGLGVAVVMALAICARGQTAQWRDSETLWRHTLACSSANVVAQNNLGSALLQGGNVDDAIVHLLTALELSPDYADARVNLGNALLRKGKTSDAIVQYHRALLLDPDEPGTHFNLGNAFLKADHSEEAISQYQTAIDLKPDYAPAHNHLGNALLRSGRGSEAITQYQAALRIDPHYANAHNNLGLALLQKGNFDDAIVQFRRAMELNPADPVARGNLDAALAQKRRMIQASSPPQSNGPFPR